MRKVLGVAAAAAAALVIGQAVRRRSASMAAISPELRSHALWMPTPLMGRRSLAVARRVYDKAPSEVDGVRVRHRLVPGSSNDDVIDVITVEPLGRTGQTGAILWLHGGGFILGRPERDVKAASDFALALGVIVAIPRYRLAPEHPFPAGLDDCFAALRWLHREAISLGVDQNRIALLGISAGGGLAASLAQRNRDTEGLPIALQMLVYPMLDDRTVLRADDQGRGNLVWSARSNRFAWTSYLGAPPGLRDHRPWAVPGRCSNLANLPPAWIGVGDLDLFYEENAEYARRLEAAGVDVEFLDIPGMYHAADKFAPTSAESLQRFRQSQVEALRHAIC